MWSCKIHARFNGAKLHWSGAKSYRCSSQDLKTRPPMSNRIALFNPAEEVEEFFRMEINDHSLMEPRYNIPPGREIVTLWMEDEEIAVRMARWGLPPSGKNDSELHSIGIDQALEGIERGRYSRCVIPVSG